MATRFPSLYPTKKERDKWWRKVLEDSDYYCDYLSTKGAVLESDSSPKDGGIKIPQARSLVVREIVEKLQNKKFQDEVMHTKEVYEGGSVKHGGTAVPGHFDVDLVLFSDSLDYQECIDRNGYDNKLKEVHKYFQKTLIGKYKDEKFHKVTLEFEFILAPDSMSSITVKLSLSPYWDPNNSTQTLFDKLRDMTDTQRELFIPSTIKLQTDYMKCVDRESHKSLGINDWICQHIHQLIQRAKAWRNIQEWPTDDGGVVQEPKSYLLCLLVIEAYNKASRKYKFTASKIRLYRYADRVTTEFKKLVKDLGKSDELTLPSDKKLQNIRADYSDLLPEVSKGIIDPANPTNNLYVSGMPGRRKDIGWKAFAEKVDSIDLNMTAEELKR